MQHLPRIKTLKEGGPTSTLNDFSPSDDKNWDLLNILRMYFSAKACSTFIKSDRIFLLFWVDVKNVMFLIMFEVGFNESKILPPIKTLKEGGLTIILNELLMFDDKNCNMLNF